MKEESFDKKINHRARGKELISVESAEKASLRR